LQECGWSWLISHVSCLISLQPVTKDQKRILKWVSTKSQNPKHYS